MPPDTRLRLVAEHILETLTDALTARGIDVPTRRYVHVGQVAFDFAGQKCVEHFVVSWNASFQTRENSIDCTMPLLAQFTVTLLRCVPVPRGGQAAPTQEALETSALALLEESWTLSAVIVDETLNGNLLDQHIDQVAIVSATAIGPEGGASGVAVQIIASIL